MQLFDVETKYLSFFRYIRLIATLSLTFSLAHAQQETSPVSETASSPGLEAVFTLIGVDGQAIVRAITRHPQCPAITWDEERIQKMHLRADASTLPSRPDTAQEERKAVEFGVRSCEIDWPKGVQRASINNQAIPAPRPVIRRIVLLGDTGCRLKGSDNAFQNCLEHMAWPFAQLSKSAAALQPDLVVHLGDIHYRESPCPSSHTGCAGVSWGYGWDAWSDDFFKPAAPLLATAPWVLVRGNHESCNRAGQGWMRFIDPLPWSEIRSCNSLENDFQADFTEPFAVPLSSSAQLLIFDSSKVSGTPYSPQDPIGEIYERQHDVAAKIISRKPQNFFLSHHPLFAVVEDRKTDQPRAAGSRGLQSAFARREPKTLLPDSVSIAIHGHLHLFESISFSTPQSATLILGNSGSMIEAKPPQTVHENEFIYLDAIVNSYRGHSQFGFALLENSQGLAEPEWLLTEFNPEGEPVFRCHLKGRSSICSQ